MMFKNLCYSSDHTINLIAERWNYAHILKLNIMGSLREIREEVVSIVVYVWV